MAVHGHRRCRRRAYVAVVITLQFHLTAAISESLQNAAIRQHEDRPHAAPRSLIRSEKKRNRAEKSKEKQSGDVPREFEHGGHVHQHKEKQSGDRHTDETDVETSPHASRQPLLGDPWAIDHSFRVFDHGAHAHEMTSAPHKDVHTIASTPHKDAGAKVHTKALIRSEKKGHRHRIAPIDAPIDAFSPRKSEALQDVRHPTGMEADMATLAKEIAAGHGQNQSASDLAKELAAVSAVSMNSYGEIRSDDKTASMNHPAKRHDEKSLIGPAAGNVLHHTEPPRLPAAASMDGLGDIEIVKPTQVPVGSINLADATHQQPNAAAVPAAAAPVAPAAAAPAAAAPAAAAAAAAPPAATDDSSSFTTVLTMILFVIVLLGGIVLGVVGAQMMRRPRDLVGETLTDHMNTVNRRQSRRWSVLREPSEGPPSRPPTRGRASVSHSIPTSQRGRRSSKSEPDSSPVKSEADSSPLKKALERSRSSSRPRQESAEQRASAFARQVSLPSPVPQDSSQRRSVAFAPASSTASEVWDPKAKQQRGSLLSELADENPELVREEQNDTVPEKTASEDSGLVSA